MNIILNGETHEVKVGATLASVLGERHLSAKRLAVEVNQEVVPRSHYDGYRLRDGDRVEIVHAIGGG